ncbi:MAG: response regulator [Janthinobacterium lividum]
MSGLQLESVRRQRILYAEDDVDIGHLVTGMLLDEGFDVTKVESGDDGVTSFDNQPFHLLLTDVRMPGAKDGLDLAAYALGRNPDLPVVIVSGFAEGLGARLASLGQRATLLRKPFLMGELISAIHSALLSASASAAVIIISFGMADDLLHAALTLPRFPGHGG